MNAQTRKPARRAGTGPDRPAGLPSGIALNLDICDRLDAKTDDEMADYLASIRAGMTVAQMRAHTLAVRAKMAEALAAYGFTEGSEPR